MGPDLVQTPVLDLVFFLACSFNNDLLSAKPPLEAVVLPVRPSALKAKYVTPCESADSGETGFSPSGGARPARTPQSG